MFYDCGSMYACGITFSCGTCMAPATCVNHKCVGGIWRAADRCATGPDREGLPRRLHSGPRGKQPELDVPALIRERSSARAHNHVSLGRGGRGGAGARRERPPALVFECHPLLVECSWSPQSGCV